MSIVAINAKHPEEIRVATVNKQQVTDLYIENTLKKPSLKDIYVGVIRSIEPSVAAVFVEYGPKRHGFLPVKDVASEYFKDGNRSHLKASLKVGQPLIVQITKEEREDKGAMLTTYITFPSTYLVLMPNQPSSGGVSKEISHDVRKDMQHIVNQLTPPANMSVILRTAAVDQPIEELQHELTLLVTQWEEIKKAAKSKKAPFLLFQEGDIIERTIRDYARKDVTEIIIDDPEVYANAKRYATIRPDLLNILRLYEGRMPLFLHLGIEDEVEAAFQSVVRLPSGGSIILNRAAACFMIDVNSGSSTKYGDIEETAFKTNLEAAEMIAKQLRLRDLGGLIMIDFIGMREDAHKRQVETKLWESMSGDRARIYIGPIWTRLDVIAMSRQRLRSSLGRVNEDVCDTCQGSGIQRSIESLALSIIRTVEKKLFLKKVSQIRVEASLALVTYLSNEKRDMISALEKEHQFKLLLLPNPHLGASKYRVTSLSNEELETGEKTQAASHQLQLETAQEAEVPARLPPTEVPAVARFSKGSLYPTSNTQLGFTKRVFSKLGTLINAIKPTGHDPLPVDPSSNRARRTSGKAPLNIRTKKPLHGLAKPSTRRENTTASNLDKTSKKPVKKTIGYSNVANQSRSKQPQQKPLITKDRDTLSPNTKSATAIHAEPRKTSLASGAPFKRSVVHRYGGEPRLQKRGY